MNIHLVRHLTQSVQMLGPLWSQSTFCFETSNGVLVRSRNAKKDYLQQMSWKYCMKFSLRKTTTHEKNISAGGNTKIHIKTEHLHIFTDHGIPQSVYTHITIREKKYKSTMSKKISTIDYFVQFLDETIGAIQYYFTSAHELYAVVELFTVVKCVDHLIEIEASSTYYAKNINEIDQKLIYMNINSKKIVTKIPNRYEKT